MELVINSKNMEKVLLIDLHACNHERVEPMMVLTWKIPAKVSSGDFFDWL